MKSSVLHVQDEEHQPLLEFEDKEENSNRKITIEEGVSLTGNQGLGKLQLLVLLICSLSTSSETLIYNFFGLFTHEPVINCILKDGSTVSCSTDDFCENDNGTFVDYEIDWSLDNNDGTVRNWITEYDLLCENKFMGFSITIYFVGTIFGGFFGNGFSEIWGRRSVLSLTLFFQIVLLLIMILGPLMKSKYVLTVCFFFMGLTFAAHTQVAPVYVIEMTSVKYKSIFSNTLQLFNRLWYLGLLLFLYETKNTVLALWITLGLTVVLFGIVTWVFCESPRFLFARSYVSKTLRTLEYMMKFNGKEVVPIILQIDELKQGILSSSMTISHDPTPPGPSKYNPYSELFSSKKAFTVFSTLALIWIMQNLLYFGVTVTSDAFRGSLFTVLLIFGISSLIGAIMVMIFAEYLPRKIFFGSSSLVICLSFMAYWIIGDRSSLMTEISLLTALSALASMTLLLILITAELFPTFVRSAGFGLTNVTAKFMVLAIPYLSNLMGEHFVIFYVIAGGTNFLMTFFLEETRGVPLREDWVL